MLVADPPPRCGRGPRCTPSTTACVVRRPSTPSPSRRRVGAKTLLVESRAGRGPLRRTTRRRRSGRRRAACHMRRTAAKRAGCSSRPGCRSGRWGSGRTAAADGRNAAALIAAVLVARRITPAFSRHQRRDDGCLARLASRGRGQIWDSAHRVDSRREGRSAARPHRAGPVVASFRAGIDDRAGGGDDQAPTVTRRARRGARPRRSPPWAPMPGSRIG